MNDSSNNTPRSFQELMKDEFDVEVNELEKNEISTDKTKETQISLTNGSFLSFDPKLIGDLTQESSNLEWIWNGYIAKGHLTLFSALWKVGKSTLISQLMKSIQNKESFAGQETHPSKILIISEESESIWARRKDDLGLNIDCWISCRPIRRKLNYDEWIKLLQISSEFCVNNKIDLLIIDTLSGFWNVIDENNASAVSASLLPINELLTKDIAVLLIHHFRKSGGSEGTATRGSGALGSTADILMEFTRLNGENPNDTQRQLRTFSRFEETPTEVVIELIDGVYITRGTKIEVSKEAKIQKVLTILNDCKDSGLTVKGITDNWDYEEFGSKPTQRTIRNYIDSLLIDGRVKQIGNEMIGKTKAFVYSITDNNVGKETSNLGGIEEIFGGKLV